MALYGLSQRTITGPAIWEIRSTSTNKPRILEFGLTQTSSNNFSSYGIGKPRTIGISPTSPQNFVDESDGNGPASQTTAAVAWGTAPTPGTNFNRRFTLGTGVIGPGIIFSFPRGLVIPISSSIGVFNLSSALTCDVYAIIDE